MQTCVTAVRYLVADILSTGRSDTAENTSRVGRGAGVAGPLGFVR